MKPEYHFTIARTDRIYLVALVLTLMGWELIKYVLPDTERTILEIHQNRLDADLADDTIQETGTTVKELYDSGASGLEHDVPPEEADIPTPPDPILMMQATEADLVKAGLSPRVASNIMKYKAAGGVLDDAEDLMKIYGMDSVQWEKAGPFLVFPEKEKPATAHPAKTETPLAPMDINSASIEAWESLPGIGPVLAERIIKFREGLGGFHSVDQVQEVYGLPPETMERIRPRLTIVTLHTTIDVNTIDFHSMAHPYLNKKVSRILSAYRQQHGRFESIHDLRKAYPPDTSWCDKLTPYLRFN